MQKRVENPWHRRLQTGAAILVLQILCLIIFSVDLRGEAGALDSGFGDDGKLALPLGGAANAIVCEPDGKIVVGGSFGVARLHQDGSFDASFGDGGRVSIGPTNPAASVSALIRQPDGKMVVSVGRALVRLLSSGALDPNFGQGGIALAPAVTNRNESITALGLQPDGRIIASGISSLRSGGGSAFLGLRFTADGASDPTFGSGGRALAVFNSSLAVCRALVLQDDGGIVVGGGVLLNGHLAFGLARFTTTGVLDAGFGTGGEVAIAFSGANFSQINGLALQSDGRIIAAGVANGATAADFALARLNQDGSLDDAFGDHGVQRSDFFQGSRDIGAAVAVLPDDRIIVAGSTGPNQFKYQFALARYNPDGHLDSRFGQGGFVKTQFQQSTTDEAYALGIAGDGRIILAGLTPANGTDACALVRFHVDDLAVLATPSPNRVAVGDTLYDSILVENHRYQGVTGVRLIAQLPSSVGFQSVFPTQGICTNDGDRVICDLGSLPSGGQVAVTIFSALHATAHLCNNVLVFANETDPVLTNSAVACATLDPVRERTQNLAVTAIRAPQRVLLNAKHPVVSLLVGVQIQNRSSHVESITNLSGVVDLEVRSLTNSCPDLGPVLLTERPQARLPVSLAPKGKLLVFFRVTYSQDCVPDPRRTKPAERHNDYEYVASVQHDRVDDNRDTFPQDDICPRAAVGKVTTAGGPIQDRGCGGKLPILGGFLGAPVVTDVIVK